MTAAGVPTAAAMPVARVPCVVKADGLAAGKGVFVCRSPEELDVALGAVGSLGGPFVVEELLEGPEVSVFAVCDGVDALALAPAQDFKRAYDGDDGPNTGGMGSYAPVPGLGPAEMEQVLEAVHRPVLEELGRRGASFVGLLYAGLMLTHDGLRVLEFNCRFGDPETQSVLPMLDGDLAQVLAAASQGELSGVSIGWKDAAAVTVVVAAAEYPERGDRGSEITGLADAEEHALVFQAGTALQGDRLVTNGGRVLNVTGVGETLGAARDAAYAGVAEIAFDGAWSRSDIALAAADGRAVTLNG
jgi:phosphoribosylamine---glycine ligase